jgi:hypothetical protein
MAQTAYCWPGFYFRQVNISIVVNKVALGQVFPPRTLVLLLV